MSLKKLNTKGGSQGPRDREEQVSHLGGLWETLDQVMSMSQLRLLKQNTTARVA